jgi:hypothetical protein
LTNCGSVSQNAIAKPGQTTSAASSAGMILPSFHDESLGEIKAKIIYNINMLFLTVYCTDRWCAQVQCDTTTPLAHDLGAIYAVHVAAMVYKALPSP